MLKCAVSPEKFSANSAKLFLNIPSEKHQHLRKNVNGLGENRLSAVLCVRAGLFDAEEDLIVVRELAHTAVFVGRDDGDGPLPLVAAGPGALEGVAVRIDIDGFDQTPLALGFWGLIHRGKLTFCGRGFRTPPARGDAALRRSHDWDCTAKVRAFSEPAKGGVNKC